MSSLKTGISLYRIGQLVGGDTVRALDIVRQADRGGIDIASVSDHVVLATDARDTYPLGPENFRGSLDDLWYEPLTFLSVIAGTTEQIRLSTNILIAPLRPGVLLAKTLATLDALSGGRVETVFGAGWLRQEFEACGMPFDGRFTHIEEQIEVCRLLWSQAPASYSGKFITFKDIWSFPRPAQSMVPIWLGIRPTERNCVRMGRLADGWLPTTWILTSFAPASLISEPRWNALDAILRVLECAPGLCRFLARAVRSTSTPPSRKLVPSSKPG